MNYSQFIIKMKDSLQKNLGVEANVETVSVQKNNGIVLQGIAIRRKGDQIVPTIYLERFYEDYLEGRMLEDILEEFMEVYEQHDTFPASEFEFYHTYEDVKKHLAVKLINKERNLSMLTDMPYVNFLDLAVVFYCLMESPVTGSATIMIKNTHLEQWDITVEQLYQDALHNAEVMLPGEIKTIEEILAGMILEDNSTDWKWPEKISGQFPKLEGYRGEGEKKGEGHVPLLILTNRRRYVGASCILYKDLMKKFAKKIEQGFYILPSSLHEVVLIPEKYVKKPGKLLKMVAEVNKKEIAPEDVLSDSIYYYEKETEEISIYASY